jgi:hypothetical protein
VSKKSDEAYRERAWLISLLHCCVCLYPLERHETPTEHHEACPVTFMAERRAARDRGELVDDGVDAEQSHILAKSIAEMSRAADHDESAPPWTRKKS